MAYAFVWGWLAFVALEPLVMWALHAALPARVPVEPSLLAATLGLSLVRWVLVYARLRLPVWPAFLYPLTMVVFLGVAMRSFVDAVRHRTTWKGRRIAHPRVRWSSAGEPTTTELTSRSVVPRMPRAVRRVSGGKTSCLWNAEMAPFAPRLRRTQLGTPRHGEATPGRGGPR